MTLQLISQACSFAPDSRVSRETSRVLGGALLGSEKPTDTPAWPLQYIPAPLLGSPVTLVEETWLAGQAVVSGLSEDIAWCRSGDMLYGVLEINEAQFVSAQGCAPLQAASQEAYRRIFRLLETQELPQLWRVWNYLAGINAESHGLERYRQFNIGRQDAFLEFSRGATGNVPAACAIGLQGGPLSIAFLAGAQPAVPVENPRQVSAYNYPADYGPRSPTFSRAALAYLPGQETLFISGTASIVGHQTVHPDDVVGQCDECMANIAAVVAEANQLCRAKTYVLPEFSYRVYVRHAADYPLVQASMLSLLGADTEITYVQADICRADLLLEIEAMASHILESA